MSPPHFFLGIKVQPVLERRRLVWMGIASVYGPKLYPRSGRGWMAYRKSFLADS